MNSLLHLDETVFHRINQALACEPLDWLMPWLSGSPILASAILLLGLGLLLKAIHAHRPFVQIDSLFAGHLVGHGIVCTSHVQVERALLRFTAPLPSGSHQKHTRTGWLQVTCADLLSCQRASICEVHLIGIGIAQVDGHLVRGTTIQPGVLKRRWKWGRHRVSREFLGQSRYKDEGGDQAEDDARHPHTEQPMLALFPGRWRSRNRHL